ncbi:MAG: flagellar protein FlgN [Lachnospiraceae bacterium]|nr:flagellar protein FlgN [Lachnospiraceae bacterium]
MENLISILETETSEYEILVGLSTKKTPIIIKGDLDALQQITDEEQIVVGRIQHLEKQREEVIGDIANVINKDVTELKLVNLIEMLRDRPEESGKLASVHDKLKDVLSRMVRVNEQNRELLTNAMEMVEFDMNILQSMKAAPETANYTKGAYTSGDIMGVNAGRFDAKQ